jgi:hypothetical protein
MVYGTRYVSISPRASNPADRGAMRGHCAIPAGGQGAFLLLPKRVAFGGGVVVVVDGVSSSCIGSAVQSWAG